MAVTISQKADFTVAEFDGDLTIFNVRDCYDALQPMLATAPSKIILDLVAVQDFDSAGLQLLLWLQSRCQQAEQFTLTLENNEAVGRLLALYQLTPERLGDCLAQVEA